MEMAGGLGTRLISHDELGPGVQGLVAFTYSSITGPVCTR